MKVVLLDICEGIKARRFTNESAVSRGIVLRLLQALSWPVFDTNTVASEYPIEGRRVDYALCHPPGVPKVFIEVKQVGQGNGADRQLFEYAFHRGVPMAILTDGQEWHFFLPAEQGNYDERRVYKLDILEREPEESIERLKRYLDYGGICSDAAIEAARQDYHDVAKKRQIEKTLPEAWRKLIEERDEYLIDLLADKVESLCGYKPTQDVVSNFLVRRVPLGNTLSQPTNLPPKPVVSQAPTPPNSSPASTSFGFVLYGHAYPARSGRDVMVKVLQQFIERDPSFLERFLARLTKGSARCYIARSPEALFTKSPHLAKDPDNFRELCPGWFIDVNQNPRSMEKRIREAAAVAGVRLGTDLQIRLVK